MKERRFIQGQNGLIAVFLLSGHHLYHLKSSLITHYRCCQSVIARCCDCTVSLPPPSVHTYTYIVCA